MSQARKVGIVPDYVMISHRGASYAIGQGPQFYGIWDVRSLSSQPLEWWYKTPDGWAAAWTRFTSMEVPGTITPISQPAVVPAAAAATAVRGGRRPLIAAGLLAVGVALGVIGLFGAYVAGASIAQQPAYLAPHVIYLAVWTASAALILLGGVRLRIGALLATGMSIVTFGLFLADAGAPMTDGWHVAGAGLGLAFSLLGWLACAAGSVLAFRIGPAGNLSRPASHNAVPLVMLIVAALGAAIAFAPSWDSYAFHTLTGLSQTVTEGNAFANPAAVIAGNVAVMIAVFAVAAIGACWRPVRLGAAVVAGATIPMLAQIISALILVREPASPTQFGISPAQAAGVGLTIHPGLTAIFWIFCAFVAIMLLLGAWMIISPDAAVPGAGQWLPAGTAPGAHGYASTSVASYGHVASASGPPVAQSSTSGGNASATAVAD
ncbi:MAG: hypothetical protein ACLQFR_28320 [Streptosporangiaceae bacterium]